MTASGPRRYWSNSDEVFRFVSAAEVFTADMWAHIARHVQATREPSEHVP
jgi:hypothetical protein